MQEGLGFQGGHGRSWSGEGRRRGEKGSGRPAPPARRGGVGPTSTPPPPPGSPPLCAPPGTPTRSRNLAQKLGLERQWRRRGERTWCWAAGPALPRVSRARPSWQSFSYKDPLCPSALAGSGGAPWTPKPRETKRSWCFLLLFGDCQSWWSLQETPGLDGMGVDMFWIRAAGSFHLFEVVFQRQNDECLHHFLEHLASNKYH